MKRLLLFACLAFAATIVAKAQTANGPVMKFEVTAIDYGKIDRGADPIRTFKFTNTGDEPLVIRTAQGSCGCTTPTYPKGAIMPGESSVIEVKYDTQRIGIFTKTVSLTTNETTGMHTLTITGEVLNPDRPQETVSAKGDGLKP